MLALHQHANGAVRQLEQLQHHGDDASVIEGIAARIILCRVKLGHKEDFLGAFHRRFQRGNALVATHEERDDHLRKNDNVTQRQKGILHSHSLSGAKRSGPVLRFNAFMGMTVAPINRHMS